MNNEWMNDATLKNIDPKKLEFLQALVFESNTIKKEQMLPFLMAVAKRGQENQITFSDAEINSIVAILKQYASPSELTKIEKIMLLRQKKK